MALGNSDWNISFHNSKLYHLNHVGSDHSPIMFVTDSCISNYWKPFKFFLTWFNGDSCSNVIANAWKTEFNGSPAFQFTNKMNITRKFLSKWNIEHFGNIHQHVNSLQQQLSSLQAQPHSSQADAQIMAVNNDLNIWHKVHNEFYQQKSRDSFIKDMDNNTKYFHSKCNRKRSINNIDSIQDYNGNWLQSREDISSYLTQHFSSISSTTNPVLDEHLFSILPTCITAEDNVLLTSIPSSDDIFATLKSMQNWSSPGPEGFQAGFYKSQWRIIVHFSKHTKTEVVNCLTSILGVKAMNSKEKYLGSPLLSGHSKQEDFKSIQENFEQGLSTYNSISLTQAGISTTIKHVLNAVPTYQMGSFKLPNQLINKLTSIERHFFWGHKENKGSNPLA
ncbi:uncharacterized protein LOC113351478 [Papaver somniferum]|uniref:uncharacterized protein LOC113351478 n=1 Tax=Papaver somniferum TaxID=3469 RepID=UPI000E6F9D4B|nr:uncharacterized protein LOC113351478 [Papaver somniferum]